LINIITGQNAWNITRKTIAQLQIKSPFVLTNTIKGKHPQCCATTEENCFSQNTISFSNSFYDIQVGDTGSSTGQDATPTEGEYSISSDGQTLTFIQNDTQTQSEQGIEITANISGVSVFTRL
jgi:hypothetical protein